MGGVSLIGIVLGHPGPRGPEQPIVQVRTLLARYLVVADMCLAGLYRGNYGQFPLDTKGRHMQTPARLDGCTPDSI